MTLLGICGHNIIICMSQEEELLENWRKSIPEGSVLSNNYEIDGKTVRLTTLRNVNELDVGKTIYVNCPLSETAIQIAIAKLSENREKLML